MKLTMDEFEDKAVSIIEPICLKGEELLKYLLSLEKELFCMSLTRQNNNSAFVDVTKAWVNMRIFSIKQKTKKVLSELI